MLSNESSVKSVLPVGVVPTLVCILIILYLVKIEIPTPRLCARGFRLFFVFELVVASRGVGSRSCSVSWIIPPRQLTVVRYQSVRRRVCATSRRCAGCRLSTLCSRPRPAVGSETRFPSGTSCCAPLPRSAPGDSSLGGSSRSESCAECRQHLRRHPFRFPQSLLRYWSPPWTAFPACLKDMLIEGLSAIFLTRKMAH